MSKLCLQIGSVIRQARESQGMTQDELAEAIGRAKNTVSSYERGAFFPSFETLGDIAKVLNRPLSFFVETAEDADKTSRNRQDREIAGRDMLHRLNEPGLTIALEQLETLIKNGLIEKK